MPAFTAAASDAEQSNAQAADVYASSGAFGPTATRAAIAALDARVLVVAGEMDSGPLLRIAAAIAETFPRPIDRRGVGAATTVTSGIFSRVLVPAFVLFCPSLNTGFRLPAFSVRITLPTQPIATA
jgi:hypothetical protein